MAKNDDLNISRRAGFSALRGGGLLGQFTQELNGNDMDAKLLPLDLIDPDPNQPRLRPEDDLDDFVVSVKKHGVIQPIVVRPMEGGRYQIVAGERRWQAAKLAGLDVIPAIIKKIDEETARIFALIENLQRHDLNAYEETIALIELLALQSGIPSGEVPKHLMHLAHVLRGEIKQDSEVSMGRLALNDVMMFLQEVGGISLIAFVKHRLPVLKLPAELQDAMRSGNIGYNAAILLGRIKDESVRKRLLDRVCSGELSVRALTDEVKKLKVQDQNKDGKSEESSKAAHYQPVVKAISKKLSAWAIPPEHEEEIERLLERLKKLLL